MINPQRGTFYHDSHKYRLTQHAEWGSTVIFNKHGVMAKYSIREIPLVVHSHDYIKGNYAEMDKSSRKKDI